MMQNDHLRPDQIPPINPLPGVVWLLAVPMILLELAFSLGDSGAIGGRLAIGWRIAGLEGYGIFPDYWRQQWQIGALDFELLRRFITYPFLHGSASQALFGVAMTLALGKFVGEIFKPWAVAVVFLGSSAFAALIYATFIPQQPLYGAFPGVYGLIGAFSFLIWVRLAGTGVNQLRAFTMIGALLAFQLIYGLFFALMPLIFPSMESGHDLSWAADLPGFVAGFLLSFLVSPGGFARVRDRIRQR